MSKFQVKRTSSDHSIIWPKEYMPSATFLSSEIYGDASSPNIQTRISWGSSCQWEPCWVARWYSPLRSDSNVKWELITQRIGNFPVDIFFFFFSPASTAKSRRGFCYSKSLQLWVNSGVNRGCTLWVEVWLLFSSSVVSDSLWPHGL